jgi:protein gp37
MEAMAENSGIEWTTHTFNPWIGCTKVSPACDHCYAEAWDKRFDGQRWGPHADRTRTKTWGNPVKWNRQAADTGTRPRVFCASLADVFDNHKSIQDAWRRELWLLIEQTPNLDWLLLTKRPQNIKTYAPWKWGEWPDNIWIGTTVENQKTAEQRIWPLLQVPARVRFVSCEPLIGPLDLTSVANPYAESVNALTGKIADDHWVANLNWVITGGESGTHFRPAKADWFRSLRDQCAASGVPFLFKQWEGRNQREIKAKGRELDGIIHDGYPQPIAA